MHNVFQFADYLKSIQYVPIKYFLLATSSSSSSYTCESRLKNPQKRTVTMFTLNGSWLRLGSDIVLYL